jgi:pimeloyl-ACP methyl ester carboxylesterase
MNAHVMSAWRPTRRETVIALHCSGAGANEWRSLGDKLGDRYELLAPEHYGSESTEPWSGEHIFTLADEAARTIARIDDREEKVHLVGHSYGGGVALQVALTRPHRIASMTLYEPSAFHLLRQMGVAGAEGHVEITKVARRVCRGILNGDYRGSTASFIDYWNGPGAWEAMPPAVQNALTSWMPKGPLEFGALINNPTHSSAYRALHFPTLIVRGEHAPLPTRLIAEWLPDLLPDCRLTVLETAGHMGPMTHASEVTQLIKQHLGRAMSAKALVA